jgi:hypothetical protein
MQPASASAYYRCLKITSNREDTVATATNIAAIHVAHVSRQAPPINPVRDTTPDKTWTRAHYPTPLAISSIHAHTTSHVAQRGRIRSSEGPGATRVALEDMSELLHAQDPLRSYTTHRHLRPMPSPRQALCISPSAQTR